MKEAGMATSAVKNEGGKGLFEVLEFIRDNPLNVARDEIRSAFQTMCAGTGLPLVARNALGRLLAQAETIPVDVVAGEFARQLGFDDLTPEYKVVVRLAQVAETSMDGNDYHGPQHAVHVFANAMMLSGLFAEHGPARVELDNRDRLKLLIAAIGHDAGHDGTANNGQPFRLEAIAADLTIGVMTDVGCFSAEEMDDVRALIMSTEPMERRKVAQACDLAERGMDNAIYAEIGLPEPMQRITTSPKLALMAGHLSDADLFSSIAAGIDESTRQSERVFREQAKAQGKEYAGINPLGQKFFLNHIATTGFASLAGSNFLPALADLRKAVLGDDRDLTFAVNHKPSYAGGGLPPVAAMFGISDYPVVETPLHPDISKRFADILVRFNDGPDGGRILGITARETGGITVFGKGAKLEISRAGVIMHYVMDKGMKLADDTARGIPALSVPEVKPNFALGAPGFLEDPHGVCSIKEKWVSGGSKMEMAHSNKLKIG
jgi:hypothetical protein